jgi:endonuclease-3
LAYNAPLVSDPVDRRRCLEVVAALHRLYPDADCELRFESPLELLVATILSAQSTDKRVNEITHDLFRKYRCAEDYAKAEPAGLEDDIRSSGFFRMKAKNLIGMGRALVEEHGGEVPRDMEALVRLPGVARKTANVVLGTAFGMAEGVVVDTHVKRLALRLGLSASDRPEQIERDLMAVLPVEEWIFAAHALIWHGRRVCVARRPLCSSCGLSELCPRIGVEEGKAG